ncbi:MAG TPA: hypothetical protein ENK53_05610 [Thiotrichales bacterium]|nr:hypothetical protein [Thiotrichales bacterium]
MKPLSLFLIPLLLATAPGYADSINPSRICDVTNGADAVRECRDGDLLLFNMTEKQVMKQSALDRLTLPLDVSGAFCNFTSPIVYTTAGVTCVFTTARKKGWKALGLPVD